MENQITSDQILASAARFLIDGGEEDAASLLLSCSLDIYQSGDSAFVGDETVYAVHVKLTGPRPAYDILKDQNHPITNSIRNAIQAVLSEDEYIKHFTVHAKLVQIDPKWRQELLEIARGKGVSNQALANRSLHIWNNLHFRSKAEVCVAAALDKLGVLFFPNCLGRATTDLGRANKEPDFLICANGKWGVLEVDGEPFHPASRAVEDHARDRIFRTHGIRVVEHFDANECYNHPDEVVKKFLALLEKV